jgi:60 kDa SS-A/Ro ribonucleoprotein
MEDALERSFTEGVTKTGQRIMVGLDVSGSMSSRLSGSSVLSAREAAVAIALGYVKAEDEVAVFAFSTRFQHLPWTRKTSYIDAVAKTNGMPFSGTDCALPMIAAQQLKVNVDTFVVITDNETWSGQIQPMEALRQYRKASGLNAKLAVVGLTATRFTIADPRDPGTMDFVGFTSDLPRSIEKFMVL